MLFSSLLFLYIFLPVSLLGYYILPKVARNSFLLLISLIFFAWGGVSYSLLLIISIILNYIFGIQIDKRKKRKLWLAAGIAINLLFLGVFKYANFIIDNLNGILNWIDLPTIKNPSILLPIGISFYTFQAISYLVDIYRRTCQVQKNIINLGLYISLFPQLIAGPIVRYYDIQKQFKQRKHSLDKFQKGIIRFTLGFAKKVIIANTMAYVADEVFSVQTGPGSMLISWIGILAYTLQIYYDFAGYSDMAIGLAGMFGFDLLENFNFPYLSKSIKEFWRRWHISLSNWFRDYLYVPLGGNRLGRKRTILNLLIIFFVTGFWHGASWNFLIWGLVHGFFLVLERTKFGNKLKQLPSFIQSFYTLFVVIMAWVLFRIDNIPNAINYYKSLFFMGNATDNYFLLYKIVNMESVSVFLIAIFGALGGFTNINTFINRTIVKLHISEKHIAYMKTFSLTVFMLIVILYGTGDLVLGRYNPFIYFRF